MSYFRVAGGRKGHRVSRSLSVYAQWAEGFSRGAQPYLLVLVVAACSPAPGKGSGSGGFGGQPYGGTGAFPAGGYGGFGAQPPGNPFGDSGLSIDSGYYPSGGTTGSGGGSTVPPPPPPPPPPGPVQIDECPGPLDAATAAALQGGGPLGGRLLYPYDGTVFPNGLLPPVMQWEQQGTADAVYLHMKSKQFEYKGCFGPNGQMRMPVPGNAWTIAGQKSEGSQDPLSVELAVKSGGNVFGFHQTLYFARGNLKGVLFYNTYTSPQAGNNGAVMRLQLGATAPEVFLTDSGFSPVGPCWSCHSLAANGNLLVAQHHAYPNVLYQSASFDLAQNPGLRPPATVTLDGKTQAEMGLGAVYPDGSRVLTMGSPGDSTTNPLLLFPDAPGNVPGMLGTRPSKLLNTSTGAEIPMTGWTVQYAQMPSFSPDGSLIVFNWHEKSNGHTLAIANFDAASNTVSNIRVIFEHQTLFPGWPWVTPDNQSVIFVLGNAPDFVSSYPGRVPLAASDLMVVDLATNNARPLARANGYMQDGAPTYLPQPGRDEHLNFFPTMSPIASGGYFWAFFTSRRTYGNTIKQIGDDAITKKIWVSAINIANGAAITDPSNPPFYLPGQEDAAGNIRAFAALEPCHAHGDTCETGVDCCEGRCWEGHCGEPPPPPPPDPGEPPPPPACRKLDEQCGTVADCCDKTASCIRHFCAIVEPPH